LDELSVATIAYHILKGLKILHSYYIYHGNIKLENIIFSPKNNKDTDIFLINFKFVEEITEGYRERLIKKGNNFYIAPEVLDGLSFNT